MFKILTCVLELVDVFWRDAPDGVIEGVEAIKVSTKNVFSST